MQKYRAAVNEVKSLIHIAVPQGQATSLMTRVENELEKIYKLGYQEGADSQMLCKEKEVEVKPLITITNAYLVYYPQQVAYCWRYSDGSGRYTSYERFHCCDWSGPAPKLHTPFREDWLPGISYMAIPVDNVPAYLADLPGMNRGNA